MVAVAHARLCLCMRVCVHVSVFVSTPVGSIVSAPNYLWHKSTVGALLWLHATDGVLGDPTRAISLTFKVPGIYFSGSAMNINLSF